MNNKHFLTDRHTHTQIAKSHMEEAPPPTKKGSANQKDRSALVVQGAIQIFSVALFWYFSRVGRGGGI